MENLKVSKSDYDQIREIAPCLWQVDCSAETPCRMHERLCTLMRTQRARGPSPGKMEEGKYYLTASTLVDGSQFMVPVVLDETELLSAGSVVGQQIITLLEKKHGDGAQEIMAKQVAKKAWQR